jgi:hypothetical protein
VFPEGNEPDCGLLNAGTLMVEAVLGNPRTVEGISVAKEFGTGGEATIKDCFAGRELVTGGVTEAGASGLAVIVGRLGGTGGVTEAGASSLPVIVDGLGVAIGMPDSGGGTEILMALRVSIASSAGEDLGGSGVFEAGGSA